MAAIHSRWLGELARARALFEESIRMATDAGASQFCWWGRMGLVILAFDQGDVSSGRRLGDDLLASSGEAYEPWQHCLTRSRLAEAECRVGDLEAAARHLMVAVPLAARFGFHGTGGEALRICSEVEAARGREERRWRLVGAAMSLRDTAGCRCLPQGPVRSGLRSQVRRKSP